MKLIPSVQSLVSVGRSGSWGAGYRRRTGSRASFTLLEMIAAMTITVILVLLLTSAFNQASRSWLQSENRIETATQARVALQHMTTLLGQAIVSPVYDFLGQQSAVAFVAVTGGENGGGGLCDLAENVFSLQVDTNTLCTLRAWKTPFDASGSSPTNFSGASANWDVQIRGGTVARKSIGNPGGGWPCSQDDTTADNRTILMRNVLGLQFQYFYTNTVAGSSGSTITWNSTDSSVATCTGSGKPALAPQGAGPAYQRGKIPYGVLITLTAVDQRAAARLAGLTTADPAFQNITNQSARTYSAFALINYQKE